MFVEKSDLQQRKFHIVGVSLGGFISINYVSKYPEKVHSLIVINPYGVDDQATNSSNAFIANDVSDGVLTFKSNDHYNKYINHFSNGALVLPKLLVTLLRH